jgi:hypothetical protein
LCECKACSFRFFDSRLTDSEVQRLYANYRGVAYFKARHAYEFWYSKRVNDGIGIDESEIVSRKANLSQLLGERSNAISTVLDFGGDRGQFIPEDLGTARFVYELSDAKPVEGVKRLTSLEGMQFDLVMMTGVLEHCSEPRQILEALRPLGHDKTLFYIAVPDECPSLACAGTGVMQEWYLRTLLRARPLLQLVDLYSTIARLKFGFIPPLGLQKCSEHLNFFTEQSLQKVLGSAGFALLDSGLQRFDSVSPFDRSLYGLAQVMR